MDAAKVRVDVRISSAAPLSSQPLGDVCRIHDRVVDLAELIGEVVEETGFGDVKVVVAEGRVVRLKVEGREVVGGVLY